MIIAKKTLAALVQRMKTNVSCLSCTLESPWKERRSKKFRNYVYVLLHCWWCTPQLSDLSTPWLRDLFIPWSSDVSTPSLSDLSTPGFSYLSTPCLVTCLHHCFSDVSMPWLRAHDLSIPWYRLSDRSAPCLNDRSTQLLNESSTPWLNDRCTPWMRNLKEL